MGREESLEPSVQVRSEAKNTKNPDFPDDDGVYAYEEFGSTGSDLGR